MKYILALLAFVTIASAQTIQPQPNYSGNTAFMNYFGTHWYRSGTPPDTIWIHLPSGKTFLNTDNGFIYVWNDSTTVWTKVTMTGTSTVYGLPPIFVNSLDTVGINLVGVSPISVVAGTTTDTIKYTGASTDTALQAGTGITIKYGTARDTINLTTPVSIANGGTGAGTANAGFNALSPMTTLGDVTYEDNTPKAVRLAGNTTSTKNFLVQTGTGTVSAAPAWGTIAAGDVPTLNQNTTGSAGSAPAGSLTGTTLASNVITSSLTTVGTIGTGTWNGTTIATANGGTGTASAGTQYGSVYYTTTTAMASTAAGTTGQFLGANTGGAPTWQTPSSSGLTAVYPYVTANNPITVISNDSIAITRWYLKGTSNEFLGVKAGAAMKNGFDNLAIGDSAMLVDTGGAVNLIIGNSAYSNTIKPTGSGGNTVIGMYAAQHANNNIGNCVIIGTSCDPYEQGTGNVAIGNLSGSSSAQPSTGTQNVWIGYDTQNNNSSGNRNTVVGALAGFQGSGGSSDNSFFGNNAGSGATTGGSQNTCVGSNATGGSGFSNSTCIGYNSANTASNQVQLGNASITMVNTSGGITEGGKLILQSVIKAANYTFDASGTDYCVIESGNGTTVTLPATATLGRHCEVVFANTTAANTMTVSGNGHNVSGVASVTLNAATAAFTAQNSIIVVGDGTNWWIVSSN